MGKVLRATGGGLSTFTQGESSFFYEGCKHPGCTRSASWHDCKGSPGCEGPFWCDEHLPQELYVLYAMQSLEVK